MFGNMMLSLLIWLPLFGGGAILATSVKTSYRIVQIISISIAIFSLLICVFLIKNFQLSLWEMQYIEYYEWLPSIGIYYSLGIDGFSLPLIVLTCFISLIVFISGHNIVKCYIHYYYASFLIMQGLIIGMFCALDSILFYIFFEAMLIPMFIIIGIWGGVDRAYATLKFFLYTFLGSVFLLISIIYLHFVALEEDFAGNLTFAISTFHSLPLTIVEQKYIFWAFLFAFAIKIPMFPVHTWLPDAHVEAPTGGSVVLAAITLKVGGYGFIRFLLPIVPDICVQYDWIVILLSLIAILYISLIALVQNDLKKLIAYSSISHMGFVTLGLFLIFSIISKTENHLDAIISIEGSMMQMISHGFISGALFLCVGVLYERMHTRLINNYGGVVNTMPVFASFFMLFAMANSGLPGTSGFVGEFLVILSAFKVNIWYSLFAGSTLLFGAAYTLWMYKKVIFGTIKNDAVALLYDLRINEKIIFLLLSFCILFFGIYPKPLLDIMHSSAEHLIIQVMQSKI
ncbi:MAG: NADH-quinone oxidoreductase subunit M [Candidatus Azosocius agrarius]|nr:MAG: NADH-quinone oxidoreductase subunit M [Gammaproteobacteria bacterium]